MKEIDYTVPALKRGLDILCLFNRERRSIGAPEMASALGLSRSTVFRLVFTLEAMGFLRKDASGRRYALGPTVLGMGFDYLASLDVVEVARPMLETLRDRTGCSTHLSVRDGAEIIYVARHAGHASMSGSVTVGTRLPAHASGMGRVLLAELTEDEIDRLYDGEDLPPRTAQTPTSLAALKTLLAGDRARGFVLSQSFFERGVSAVSAAVRDGSGAAIAAINLTLLDPAVTLERIEIEYRDLVLATAADISAALNWRPAAAAD